MAVIIEQDGIRKIHVGGEVKGTIVVGNNKVVELKTDKAPQDLANLADELDNATFRKTAKDFSEEKLAEILQKLKLIKDKAPTTYQDVMKRLGYQVEDEDVKVVNTGSGAVATGGQVRAGKGGIARRGNVGSITQNPDGSWKIED